MGYGEFGGGGSVGWFVRHGSGTITGAGIDPDPTHDSGGRFHVFVNGNLVANIAVDNGHIVVKWGRHITDPAAPYPPDTTNAPFEPPNEAPRE